MVRYFLVIIAVLSLSIGFADQQEVSRGMFFEVGGGFGYAGTGYQNKSDGFELRNDQGLGVNLGGRVGFGPFQLVDDRPFHLIGDVRWSNGITTETNGSYGEEKFTSNNTFIGVGWMFYPLPHMPNYHASISYGAVYSHVGLDITDINSDSGGGFGWGLNIEVALDLGTIQGRGLLVGGQLFLSNVKNNEIELYDGDITVEIEMSHAFFGVFARYRF